MSAVGDGLTRRRALKLLAANVAAITAACGKPPEEVLPYVRMPERLIPGIPLRFASTLPLGGYGRGVICTSVEGRPIKVEGNPLHPASLGSTDLFAEAHVLSLYDPDRSQAVRQGGEIRDAVALETALADALARVRAKSGDGLRLLTGPLTSPTLLRQIADLRHAFPQMRWHVYDPLDDGAARAGAALAFGRDLVAVPKLSEAAVIVTLDADPLGVGPWQIVNGRGFADRRRVRKDKPVMSRLYAFEPVPSVTGMKADHRFAATPEEIAAVAAALAHALGADMPETDHPAPELPPPLARAVAAIAAECRANTGHALVLAGPTQAPEIHALAHWINAAVKAPVTYRQRPDAGTLGDLAADLDAGHVEALLIADVNPVYDAPPELRFGEQLAKAGFTLHHGLHRDETSARCGWHMPAPHPLESWGDIAAYDGTPSLMQPLIEPLYQTRSLGRLLALAATGSDAKDYDLVRATWQASHGGDGFEGWWRQALHDGVIRDGAPAPVDPGSPKLPSLSSAATAGGLTLVLAPDPTIYDGSFANNAWLQECPKPLTKDVWGNAAVMAPVDAGRLGLADEDTITLAANGQEVRVPVRINAGVASGIVGLTLGAGRTEAGDIGSGIGANAYRLRSRAAEWRIAGVTVVKSRGVTAHSTQKIFAIDGDRDEIFPSYPLAKLGEAQAASRKQAEPKPTLLPTPNDAHALAKWAMVIDNASCIGCNACVLACQVENNVPVVGPDEIDNNRDMHWLRIDSYELPGSGGQLGFEPVPCMHCETAPCEPVCPVGASIHDSEGLNVQVYNRCVGTRFCEANCPYKVRRFNFFGYADGQTYGNLDKPVVAAHNNPNVSVRARGVMEKCTFCVQRISGARRTAEKEMRPLRDGDVSTACQNACPTQAITFGNLNDPASRVGALRNEPQHFTLLASLNTKPRTTYLADLRNPNPDLAGTRG